MHTVFDAAGGAEGVLRLSRAWHERVMADEVVSHAFSHGFRSDHSERLAAYWGEALTDVGLSDPVRAVLLDYFAWATTTSMAAYPDAEGDVPPGLPLPHWSWEGLQR